MKINVKMIAQVLLFTSLLTSTSVLAQATEDDLEMLVNDTKNDLMVVVGGGLAGAVLGLSTLSFVDEPKDHTRNIIVGASVGIIFGVVFVAASQATKTQDLLNGEEDEMQPGAMLNIKEFGTYARLSWHQERQVEYQSSLFSPVQLHYSF